MSNAADGPADLFSCKVFLFTDEGAFRRLVGLTQPGGTVPGVLLLGHINDGSVILLDEGTPVRVIERVEGGAKVVVASEPHAGQEGWMIERALPEEQYGVEA